MTFTYIANVLTYGRGHGTFIFKNIMKANGWTVVESGDGLGGNFSGLGGGDVLTAWGNTTTSPNNIINRQSWFRLQAPEGGREFVIQRRDNVSYELDSIYYSANAGFVDGSPSATSAPTASDQVNLLGTNLEWANEGEGGGAGSYRNLMDFIIGDADEGYAFFARTRVFGYQKNNSSGPYTYATGIFLDVLDNADPNDEDPAVVDAFHNQMAKAFYDGRSLGNGPTAWKRYVNSNGETSMTRYAIPRYLEGNGTNSILNVDGNPWDGETTVIPGAPYIQSDGTNAISFARGDIKGTSKFFGYITSATTLDMTADLKWLHIGNQYALRWDGVTIPRL